jgi:hypothetical protein
MNRSVRFVSLWFLMLCAGISAGGCASIVSGSAQEMTFESEPEGATVMLDGNVLGKTPLTTTVKKKSRRVVSFVKDGYQSQTMQLTTSLDGWFWGNFIFSYFGPFSSTTDGVSGAVHEYVPGRYYVTLASSGYVMVPVAPGRAPAIASEQAKTKEFIVLEYSNISKDMAKGGGEYLNTMLILLGIRPEFRPAVISKIKVNLAVYNDIPSFADSVLEIASQYNR